MLEFDFSSLVFTIMSVCPDDSRPAHLVLEISVSVSLLAIE